MVSKGAHDEIGNHVSVMFEVSVEVWLKTSVGVNPKTIGKATHESQVNESQVWFWQKMYYLMLGIHEKWDLVSGVSDAL